MNNHESSKAYECIIGILGLGILIWAGAIQKPEGNWLLIGFWAFSYTLFFDKMVFLTSDAVFMPGFPIMFAALCTTGFFGVAFLVMVSLIWHGIHNFYRFPGFLLTMGSIAVSIAFAGSMAMALWGTVDLVQPLSTDGLIQGFIIILSYHLLLAIIHSLFCYIEDPEYKVIPKLTQSLARNFRWLVPSYYFFSMLLAHLAQTGGVIACLFFLFPIYALRKQFYFSQAYKEEAIRASTDSLTGITNREGLRRQLSSVLSPAKLPAAVLIIDIDDFKSVNDQFGHGFGDNILCIVASLLKRFVRKDDLVVRWGGEEFVMFLWNTSIEQASAIADRICEAVRNCDLPGGVKITVSIGCSGTKNINEVSKLIPLADNALYSAKYSGKDQVYIADF
ncbi:MAG: GGDEF domain-containing protein [Firmicutes bacterium]|nr:GGDEF domain-containing protein [Bacillota bacterium]